MIGVVENLEVDDERFRALLIGRRDELLATAAAGDDAAMAVELDQQRVGRLSRMDALQSQAMSVEAKRRREQELRRISAALQRLEDGAYGDCDNCGEPVARQRLEVDPAATLCIGCAGRAES